MRSIVNGSTRTEFFNIYYWPDEDHLTLYDGREHRPPSCLGWGAVVFEDDRICEFPQIWFVDNIEAALRERAWNLVHNSYR